MLLATRRPLPRDLLHQRRREEQAARIQRRGRLLRPVRDRSGLGRLRLRRARLAELRLRPRRTPGSSPKPGTGGSRRPRSSPAATTPDHTSPAGRRQNRPSPRGLDRNPEPRRSPPPHLEITNQSAAAPASRQPRPRPRRGREIVPLRRASPGVRMSNLGCAGLPWKSKAWSLADSNGRTPGCDACDKRDRPGTTVCLCGFGGLTTAPVSPLFPAATAQADAHAGGTPMCFRSPLR
jgi:hypothetical protein